jgi:hypothetical protein
LLQIVLLSVIAIIIHESGHLMVYKLAGYSVRITLQSVRPVGNVDPEWNALALAAGPMASVLAAIAFLAIARHYDYSFGWVTAAFTNATLRTFPCAMELVRAISGGHAFSDEDTIIASAITGRVPRAAIIALLLGAYMTLSVVAARRYRFASYHALKAIAIYVLILAVGISIAILDQA